MCKISYFYFTWNWNIIVHVSCLFIYLLNCILKCANIALLTKVNNKEDIGKDLRPNSLTLTLLKIAEHFVVPEHVKPAVLKRLHPDQFGCISGSSTTHALACSTSSHSSWNWRLSMDLCSRLQKSVSLDTSYIHHHHGQDVLLGLCASH